MTPDQHLVAMRDPEHRKRMAAESARDIALGGDPDALWLIAAHEAIAHLVKEGTAHGPLPRLRSDEWADAPTEVRVASLLLCGVAYVLNGDPHRLALQLMKETSLDIHGAVPRGYWAAAANSPSHEELERRRYPWPSQQAIRAETRARDRAEDDARKLAAEVRRNPNLPCANDRRAP